MTNSDRPTPMMYDHIVKIYEAMDAEAQEEFIGTYVDEECTVPLDPNDKIRVYEGYLTNLFGELSMSIPYYTTIMKALKSMGCVDQIRRGGGSAKSRWRLLYPPTEQGFLAYVENKPGPRRQGQLAAVEQRLRQLEQRVKHLEEFLSSPLRWS